jgi:calcium-dependent protein kinase
MSMAGIKELRMTYSIGKLLGNGSYGKVYLATHKSNQEHKVAVKVINKTEMDDDDLESLKAEVEILQKVDHPNIVKYFETYDDSKNIYLVMEFCSGGELLDTISATKRNHEKVTAEAMEKMVRALIHIHASNITHKDIKPDNIMYDEAGNCKLIDFGLSQQTKTKDEKMDTIAGTPYFIAPEVLNGEYG